MPGFFFIARLCIRSKSLERYVGRFERKTTSVFDKGSDTMFFLGGQFSILCDARIPKHTLQVT